MQQTRNRYKKIVLISVFLGGLIGFPLLMLLVVMFYSAVLGNGSITIHIDNYNEMHVETFVVVPLVVLLSFLNTMYSLNRVDKELKQLFRLKKTKHRNYKADQE